MRDLAGRLAVVTGGASGMGRELVRQLASAGCHVATCDVTDGGLLDTKTVADETAVPGTAVSTFVADVADEQQVRGFRDFVGIEHSTRHINLLFNNAGIGGGGSFVLDDRTEWETTFAVCWGGVYTCLRAFLPMLLVSDEGHVVNTSSVNGFWASLGPSVPHTAYSAAKFAVKGLTEALITDFRLNAPAPARLGSTARPHRNVNCSEFKPLSWLRPEGSRRRTDGASARATPATGNRYDWSIRRGHTAGLAGPGRAVPGRCADDRGRSRDGDPRGRSQGPLANSGWH